MYSKEEREFLFSHFDKTKRVLEYGSGESSIEIASEVKELVTVEHMPNWYEHLKDKLPDNATIINAPKNDSTYENLFKPEHGSYEEWRNYIECPLKHAVYAPFDIIFIDGSARVACASLCHRLGHEDTIIFIHDCDGMRYAASYQYIKPVDIVFTMRKFLCIAPKNKSW